MKSEDGLKQRLIGAVVLLALAVIFLPVLFDRERLVPIDTTSQIPPEPQIKPVVIEPVQAPESPDLAPPPDVMYEPDESNAVEPTPQPVTLSPSGKAQPFVLQVASFRDEPKARALKDKLIQAGYSAFTRESQYKNGAVVRVYVGPKLDKNTLLEAKQNIDRQFKVDSLLLEFAP